MKSAWRLEAYLNQDKMAELGKREWARLACYSCITMTLQHQSNSIIRLNTLLIDEERNFFTFEIEQCIHFLVVVVFNFKASPINFNIQAIFR